MLFNAFKYYFPMVLRSYSFSIISTQVMNTIKSSTNPPRQIQAVDHLDRFILGASVAQRLMFHK